MKVLCLHPFLSMRAVKEMAALKYLGYRIVLIYEGTGCSVENGFGNFWDKAKKLQVDKFKGEFYLRRLFPKIYENLLSKALKDFDPDVIHCFSMPDTLAVAAIRYSGLPVIFDSRDLSTGSDHFILEDLKCATLNRLQEKIYKKIIKRFEKEANENSAGRIYSSREMLEYANSKYNIDLNRSIVLENYQTLHFVSNKHQDKLSDRDGAIHLVYTGNIYFDDPARSKKLFRHLESNSIHIHLYPTGDDSIIGFFKKTFARSKFVHFYTPLSPRKLSDEIQKYDFGLVPHPPDIKPINIRNVLPNKLFDYLAAGLPIVGRNAYALKNFIESHKVGLVYEDEEELILKLKAAENKYTILPNQFIMENHIDSVVKLYSHVLDKDRGI